MAITAEQRAVVLTALEEGASLRKAAQAASIGSEATIRRLNASDPAFAAQYAHARDQALDAMADEVIRIADDQEIEPNSRRVMVDARRWYLSKLAPKRYGDRIEHAVSVVHSTEALTTLELEQIVAKARLQAPDAEDAVLVDNSLSVPLIAPDAPEQA